MTIDYDDVKFRIDQVSSNMSGSISPPGCVSVDDIKGELWIWCLEHQDTVEQYLSENEEGKLFYVLKQKAISFLQKSRAEALGYSVEDLQFYQPKMLREILKDAYNYVDWQTFSSVGDGMPGSKRIEPTSDRVDMMIDVKMAVDDLDQRNNSIIVGRFKYGYSDEEIAEMLEIQVQSAKPAINRALTALAKKLNTPKDPEPSNSYGRRYVRSNAAARADLSNHYDI